MLLVVHETISHANSQRPRFGKFSDAKNKYSDKDHNLHSNSAQVAIERLQTLGDSPDRSINALSEMQISGQGNTIQPHEVALILKTGYAVYKDRLRSQLKTFASSSHGRDENNTIIIADFTGRTNGWDIKDAIADLNNTDPAFTSHEKYRTYQQVTSEIQEGVHITPAADPGTNNAGWSLDALKFIPGYKAAAERFPEAKFFIGIDDDTFIIWDSLMQFLSLLDPNQHLFLGSPAVMLQNNQTFLHGGSIIVVSAAAMKARFVEKKETLPLLNEKALELCCGDGNAHMTQIIFSSDITGVLAMAFNELGIEPNGDYRQYFNGQSPEAVRVSESNFCHPIFGLHHVKHEMMQTIEDAMRKRERTPEYQLSRMTTYGDILQIMAVAVKDHSEKDLEGRYHWDFLDGIPDNERHPIAWGRRRSARICKATCEAHPDLCFAWVYKVETRDCWMSKYAVPGKKSPKSLSGLNGSKLKQLKSDCPQVDWRNHVRNLESSRLASSH